MTASINRRAGERRQSQRRAEGFSFPARAFPGGPWPSTGEIIGYAIEAGDGLIGRVIDFCVEEESAVVTGLVVSTRGRLLPVRKRILVPLSAVESIDPRRRIIHTRHMRGELGTRSKRRLPWGRR